MKRYNKLQRNVDIDHIVFLSNYIVFHVVGLLCSLVGQVVVV